MIEIPLPKCDEAYFIMGSVKVPKQLLIDALNTYTMEHPEENLKIIGGN